LYLGDVVDAPPLLTDQRSYHALAERLLGGHGYSFDRNWYPFTLANEPTAHWSFLYPLLLAAVYAILGVHPLAGRLVQAVAGGLLLPLAVYGLTRSAFPSKRHVPVASAALTAIYPYFVLYSATLMTETYFIILLVHSLDLALQVDRAIVAGDSPRWPAYLRLGATLGLAVLMRQSLLPWVAVLTVWLGWRARGGGQQRAVARGLGLMIATLAICILPWTWRNYRVYGEFLLLNSNAGYAMYSAQHPMHGTSFQEYAAAPLPSGLEGMNEAQMDQALMERGIRFVLAEPSRYVRLCLSRVRAYIEFWPKSSTTWLHNLGRLGSFLLLAPLAACGMWWAGRRGELDRGAFLLPLFMVFFSAMHVMTWAMTRYRLPVDAVAVPFAALGAVTLAQRATYTRRCGSTTAAASVTGRAEPH